MKVTYLVIPVILIAVLVLVAYLTCSHYIITATKPTISVRIESSTSRPTLKNLCSMCRVKSVVSPRSVITELSSELLNDLIKSLPELSSSRNVTHLITIPSVKGNYSVLKVCSDDGLGCRLYYVLWVSKGSGVKVINYGGVKLELILSKGLSRDAVSKYFIVNSVSIVRDICECGEEATDVPDELKSVSGGYAVLRFTNVPRELSRLYLVVISNEVLISDGGIGKFKALLTSEFLIDYGNEVVWSNYLITKELSNEYVSIHVSKSLGRESSITYGIYLNELGWHRVAKVGIKAVVDYVLRIEACTGLGTYEVIQVRAS